MDRTSDELRSLWATRLSMDEARLRALLAGLPPANLKEEKRFLRFLLTTQPTDERTRLLRPLLCPVPSLEGSQEDLVAAAAAATAARIDPVSPLQVVADLLWNVGVREGQDPRKVGEQVGSLRIGKYNQQRVGVVEDPAISGLRDLFLARELISISVLPAERLAPVEREIQRRRAELHRRVVGSGRDPGDLDPAARLAAALAETRACADISAEDLDGLLGREPGWYHSQETAQSFDSETLARVSEIATLDRVRALPKWLRDDFTAALERAGWSASRAELNGQRLAQDVGQLLREARMSVNMTMADAARALGVERRSLRSREHGADFTTFRGLRLCQDAADLYRGSPRHGELTEAMTLYSDLLHTSRFQQLRSTRGPKLDDRTIVAAVLLRSLLSELNASEERFGEHLELTSHTMRQLVRPFSTYTETEWAAIVKIGEWLGGDIQLSSVAEQSERRTGAEHPEPEWLVQSVGDVAEFASLRAGLNLSTDPRVALRALAAQDTIVSDHPEQPPTPPLTEPSSQPLPVPLRSGNRANPKPPRRRPLRRHHRGSPPNCGGRWPGCCERGSDCRRDIWFRPRTSSI